MISATRIIPHRSIQFISKSNETASTVIDKIHKVTDSATLGWRIPNLQVQGH